MVGKKTRDIYSYGLVVWQIAKNGKVPFEDMETDETDSAKCSRHDLVILLKILLPKHCPFLSIEAEEMAKPSQGIHLARANNRRRYRTDLLRWIECPVRVGEEEFVAGEHRAVQADRQESPGFRGQ